MRLLYCCLHIQEGQWPIRNGHGSALPVARWGHSHSEDQNVELGVSSFRGRADRPKRPMTQRVWGAFVF
jgi:hypothetical protein